MLCPHHLAVMKFALVRFSMLGANWSFLTNPGEPTKTIGKHYCRLELRSTRGVPQDSLLHTIASIFLFLCVALLPHLSIRFYGILYVSYLSCGQGKGGLSWTVKKTLLFRGALRSETRTRTKWRGKTGKRRCGSTRRPGDRLKMRQTSVQSRSATCCTRWRLALPGK